MADLEVWKDYVTVINAARLNAIRDHIMANEGNISYQQTLINANTTSIYTNSNNIDNLSATKLPRDGSLPMTGELICNAGLKTTILNSQNGSIQVNADLIPSTNETFYLGKSDKSWKRIYAQGGFFNTLYSLGPDTVLKVDCPLEINQFLFGTDGLLFRAGFILDPHPYIQLYSGDHGDYKGSILIATPGVSTEPGSEKWRIWIWGGYETSWITIYNAHLVPGSDNELGLGSPGNRWSESHIVKGYFEEVNASIVKVSRTMPFYLENPSSSDKYLLGAGTVSTMYQFNTTVTLIGYKLMMLTSASNGYIKVTIDDANGWSYEKTYSLGSAGGYRYNESFIHTIETDNGIQLKISNCSQISSTSIVLEYK